MLVALAGWVGGAIVLVAYVLVSTRRADSAGSLYQGMNVLGGVFLTASALHAGAFPNLMINLVWIVAGSLTIVVTTRRRVRSRRPTGQQRTGQRAVEPEPAASHAA